VSKGERKRGGSTHNGTGRSVLGSVARALELVGGSRPWDDATKMGAHCVQTVALDTLVFLDDNVAARKGDKQASKDENFATIQTTNHR
jgi:hypothetical protein